MGDLYDSIRLTKIEQDIARINQFIAAFNIDKQLLIKKDTKAAPGRGTKVTTNADGIVVGMDDISADDIPILPISKIDGLRESLDGVVSQAQFKALEDRVNNLLKPAAAVKTGCKINVDANGLVTDVNDLVEEDIPTLSIDKIDGLQETINLLLSNSAKEQPVQIEHHYEQKPITIGDVLELGRTLAELRNDISTLVSKSEFERMLATIATKSNDITSKPGTYTKLSVNEHGQVTDGGELTMSDLPKIGIDDIDGLYNKLIDLVRTPDIADTIAQVDSINRRLDTMSDLLTMREQLNRVSSDNSVSELQMRLNELNNRLDNLVNDTSIITEITSIRNELTSLSDRISKIENK